MQHCSQKRVLSLVCQFFMCLWDQHVHCHCAGTLVQFEEDLFIIVLFSISARLLGVKDIFQDVRPT